ncbi:MAG: hypothetical protein MUP30_00730 [Deltaproteobacteria bacterium]|nr:hypothetical protein [Deltaproteobacteria bacterium]
MKTYNPALSRLWQGKGDQKGVGSRKGPGCDGGKLAGRAGKLSSNQEAVSAVLGERIF